MKKPLNRQAEAQLKPLVRHRINAGRVAVKGQVGFFRRQFGQVASEWKADDTRVTFADFAISEKLFAELRRDFPEDDYCSEEASPQDEALELQARFAWVADPIDGTNNFALGFPICAISLALLLNGEPIYGLIYDYSTDSILEGGPGYGVLKNQKRINRDKAAADAQTMFGLHFPMKADELDKLQSLLSKYRVRCIGSGALSASYVATGYMTGVVDFRVKVWDIAAAYALCLGAGLIFEFIEENPFPLRRFHPMDGYCPYFAGTEVFCDELRSAIL